MPTIYEAATRQQVYLEGLKVGVLREFQGTLAELSKDIRARLAVVEYETLDRLTKRSLNELLRDLKALAVKRYNSIVFQLIQWLQRFLRIDRRLVIGIYESFAEPTAVRSAREREYPAVPVLWARAKNTPLPANGIAMLDFIAALAPVGALAIVNRVRQAYSNREKVADLAAAIVGTRSAQFRDGLINRANNSARTAVATAVQHINSINEEAIGRMLYNEYDWVSVIDNATTPICRVRNGNRYRYGAGPLPPAHAGCRSTAVPVIDGQPKPPKGFRTWIKQTPERVLRDAFGKVPTGEHFEGARPLTLDEYADKQDLILTND